MKARPRPFSSARPRSLRLEPSPFGGSRTLARAVLMTLALASASHAQAPQHAFEPWAYWFDPITTGAPVFDRHQFWEDNADTAFVLAREFAVYPDQTRPYPELFLFNGAQFVPPEGVALQPGQHREIAYASYDRRGVQLYLNYSTRAISGTSFHYPDPMFFVAVDQNTQIPVLERFWNPSVGVGVSATRGAFGIVGTQVGDYAIVKPIHEQPTPPGTINALYVTAGVGYPLAEFADPITAANLARDRLLVFDGAVWQDVSTKVPLNVRDGHSSGACFADFNGDGWLDLYVGLTGDNFTGARDKLLFYNRITQVFDDYTTNIDVIPAGATADVAVADLDGDTFPDIVVANRERRDHGGSGGESIDYALRNDGTGHFTTYALGEGSDSRSVAVGDLDGDGRPEIVLGNAGSEGYSNTLPISTSEDDPIQIFSMTAPGSWSFLDLSTSFVNPILERIVTAPLTYQVLLADVTRPASPPENGPDQKLDLLIVNHRDILQHDAAQGGEAGKVEILARPNSGMALVHMPAVFANWAKCAALADLCKGFMDGSTAAEDPSLDLFIGTGNRFHGTDNRLFQNAGNPTGTSSPFDTNASHSFPQLMSYEPMPGNERGYGFDFADYNADGTLDAVQTARGYDFLVNGLLQGTNDHDNLTGNSSQFQISNWRGKLRPHGQEDATFADVDADGDLDLLIASQSAPSESTPSSALLSSVAMLLRNSGAAGGYQFERNNEVSHAYTNLIGPLYGQFRMDPLIDIQARKAGPQPGLGDRVVAGDLDNDDDVDAIVHLFQATPGGATATPVFPVSSPDWSLDPNPAHWSIGWMYLENIKNVGGAFWFRDVAPARMIDKPVAQGGVFSGLWNRGPGMDVLADFDNNGALDLYTTNGKAYSLSPPTVADVRQTYDLLFLNQGRTDWGRLVEAPAGTIPIIPNIDPAKAHLPPGSFGLAQGDIDNDGDADVVVTHAMFEPRAYPSLFVNQWDTTNVVSFVDEYRPYPHRVPTLKTALDDSVHSSDDPTDSTRALDDAKFPGLLDFDADGDLDLVLQIGANVPRFFENLGVDTNGDGVINAADTGNLGFFDDRTDELARWIRPTTGADDLQPVDLDDDGDLDLAIDPFDDEVVFWRNDLPMDDRPAVTVAWPRIGRVRGKDITLHGARLTGANMVELRYAHGVVFVTRLVTVLDDHNVRVTLPVNTPLGLAEVRVRRRNPVTLAQQWSSQHFEYTVLDPYP